MNFFYPQPLRFATALLVAATAHTSASAQTYQESPNATVLAQSALSGIRQNEIFQRNGNGAGATATIRLKLVQWLGASAKYYTISSLTDTGIRDQILSSGDFTASTNLKFALATGMSRKRVRVSFYNSARQEINRWDSQPFSVGEVFLIAGQSNASNHGDYREGFNIVAQPQHAAMNPASGVWGAVTDPIPYASDYSMVPWSNPTIPSASPWPAFVNDLGQVLGVPIGLVNVAWGGSGSSWWLPGFSMDNNYAPWPLYDRLTLGAAALSHPIPGSTKVDCSFRYVLWHQGESDAMGQEPRKAYANYMRSVVNAFQADSKCEQPKEWMIARASYQDEYYWRLNAQNQGKTYQPWTNWNSEVNVRSAQHFLANRPAAAGEVKFLQGPDTDMIVGQRGSVYRHDGVHFSVPALEMHGKLWVEKVAESLGYAYPAPQAMADAAETAIIPEVGQVWDLYRSVLLRTDAQINLDREGLRFWVARLTFGDLTLGEISANFAASDERFVRTRFAGIVGREPTWTEVGYWTAALSAQNLADEAAKLAFLTQGISFENSLIDKPAHKKVWMLYINHLDRTTPGIVEDMPGFNWWSDLLARGIVTEDDIKNAFITSDEYLIRQAFLKVKSRQPNNDEMSRLISAISATPSLRTNPSALADAVWVDN